MLLRVAVQADVSVLLKLAAVSSPQLLPIACIGLVNLAKVLDLLAVVNSLNKMAVHIEIRILAVVIVLVIIWLLISDARKVHSKGIVWHMLLV